MVNLPFGANSARRAIESAISACITMNHHRVVLMTSTKGDQRGLITHGKVMSEVKSAIRSTGIPKSVNIATEMAVTMKYGIPSAKYKVGTHNQGVPALCSLCCLLEVGTIVFDSSLLL